MSGVMSPSVHRPKPEQSVRSPLPSGPAAPPPAPMADKTGYTAVAAALEVLLQLLKVLVARATYVRTERHRKLRVRQLQAQELRSKQQTCLQRDTNATELTTDVVSTHLRL